MNLELDDDIFTNEVQYFFSLHGPRFEYMNNAMAEALSQRFGREFRPIRIFNAWPSENYDSPNYILLNDKGYKLAKELNRPVVNLPDYEDVNIEFSRNPKILQIAEKLSKKQNTVFVYPFTTAFLDLPTDGFTILGPNPILARTLDNKINQLKIFRKLKLPCNNARIYQTEQELLEHEYDVIPSYISAAYTSGGNESGLIYSPEMLKEFLARLRQINKQDSFMVSDIFEDIYAAPNVNAIITAEGKVFTLVLSDQILHGNRYLGNIYPTVISEKHQSQIKLITEKIGQYLFQQGYKGLFGLDFLVNHKGDLIVIDLNPRHQGGYVCNYLMLQSRNLSMCELELATLYDEKITLSQSSLDTDIGYAWAHSKIAPNEKGQEIKASYHQGEIKEVFLKVGSSHLTSFYKPTSVFIEGYIGYQVQSSEKRESLELDMLSLRKTFDSKVIGI